MPVLLRSQMVPVFVRRAHRLGLATDDLLARHRIEMPAASASASAAPEVSLTCSALRAFSNAVAERARDDLFGFHAALEMPRGAYGLLEYIVRNTPTLRALTAQLVRFSRLINAQLVAHVDTARGRIEERIDGEPECLGTHGNEFSLTHQVKIVREACGVRIAPRRVYFAHAAPVPARNAEAVAELADFYGTRDIVYSSGFNGVDLPAGALDTPLIAADPSLLRVLEERASELAAAIAGDDDLGGVRRTIARELETGEPTAKHVASVVGMSERTLHRRIAAQGTTFGALVDGLRHELAFGYLADPTRSVTDVALLLGYSDGRAFARAFRRWTKTTPLEWRASRRARSSTRSSTRPT